MSTEAPTIAERYQCATHSSDLRVTHRRGPVDLLIAAGWSDSLGVSLYRLQGEYDTAAREIARMSNETDAILAMSKIKSLTSTRVQLVRFATEAAKRWRVNLEPQVIGILAGQCLSAFLERNCQGCHGTGSVGGYDGKPANICRKCGGTGSARPSVGETNDQRFFAQRLLSIMDAVVSEAAWKMTGVLR
jgi:hypothetical protein